MALRLLLTLLGLSITGHCSRVATYDRAHESSNASYDVPPRTKKALDDFMAAKVKYIVMSIPDLEVIHQNTGGNYADFKRDFTSCPGVCIAAFDFRWEIPRGHGHVPASEPALFTWAPDITPEGLSAMGFMRLKMQMPMVMKDLKKALGSWQPTYMECNDPESLDPSWIVPKLKGGRMGSRKDKLNAEGMALYDKLTKELADAGEGTEEPSKPEPSKPEKPSKPEPSRPEPTPSWKPPKPAVPTSPENGFTAMSHDEIKAMVEEKVAEAAERKVPEIIEAAKAAAKAAVLEATKDQARQRAREATNDIASLAFKQGADSIEG